MSKRIVARTPFGQWTLMVIATVVLLAPAANSQWTVVNLHPPGASQSRARAADGDMQVGEAYVDGWARAALWQGSAETWVNLDPIGSSQSRALAVSGGVQAGLAYVPGWWQAALWTGSAESWVNLNPYGTTYSVVSGADGGQQVGHRIYDGQQRACLWSGTAASWVDLNPAMAMWSVATGIGDGQQVGRARVYNITRASLWAGTAASWVDLHPAVGDNSYALGVDGGRQVGYVNVVGHRASLWMGTRESWVDLHPAAAMQTEALDVDAEGIVGWATFNTGVGRRASFWLDTADSWTDLHAFLPANFVESEAWGISHHGGRTYVAGWGWNSTTERQEALLWLSSPAAAVPAPVAARATPRLERCWPNPFNPSTSIAFTLPHLERVRLAIFDLSGRLVRQLLDETRPAGGHEIDWNGADDGGERVASGVYLCRLDAGNITESLRVTLTK